MATDPTVPFQFLIAGNAENPKVQANFDALLKYIKERNNGTTAWDTFVMKGTTTNDDATAGNVGEYISSTIAFGSAVTLTNNTWADITSISLTAGDWDVSFNAAFFGSTTGTFCDAGIGTASGTTTTGITFGDTALELQTTPTAAAGVEFAMSGVRKSLSGTTTIYFKARSGFTVGTQTVWGRISARRIR